MHVFMYSSVIEEKEKEIETIIEGLFSVNQIKVFRSVDILSKELQKPLFEKPLVVILIYRKEELLDLISLRGQLHEVRLILILPDAEEGTISLAHRLRPNYLTYFHSDPMALKAVLQKISQIN